MKVTSSNMEISLVIPAHNEAKYIGPCLDSVVAHAARFKEIVVIDNASTDETAEIVRRYPRVRIVQVTDKGLTKARQAGLEATTSEFVAYIDADCRLPAQWYSTAERLIARYPNGVSWSGPAKYFDAPSMLWRLQLSLGWWASAPLMYRAIGYMLFGANFIVRRSAMEAIGGFDPDVVFYGEDMTLAKRLHTQGKTVFRMDFYIITSMRRFAAEGYFRTNMNYILNFWWPVLFGRPYHEQYKDIR